jgi:hypothetical protein
MPNAGIVYKQWRAETKLADAAKHEYYVRMAVAADDRDDDIIDHKGWILDSFNAHPVLVSSHAYEDLRKQIGEWRDLDVSKGDLRGIARYYVGEGNEEADWGANLASKGRAAYSVGFIPVESEPRKGHGGMHYRSQELLETSHVIIPSGREALQLMAKGITARPDSLSAQLARETLAELREPPRRTYRGVTLPTQARALAQQKWSSAFMPGDDDDPWAPNEYRCLVPGCDDACQTFAPVCSEHLKVLMNAPAEPPGSPPDDNDDDAIMRSLSRRVKQYQRALKAGRQISAANMTKLHTAMQALKDVHDAACDQADCPFDDDGSDLPPTERDKAQKAMGEGAGAAGGVIVSESGTHGAFSGKHSHAHDGNGVNEDKDGLHEHSHSHSDDGAHGHPHDGVNFKTAREREIEKAAQSTASQNDLPDSAFAVISSGGSKDDEGKTTPRSLRHLPHHKADGSIDLPHLRNALARVSQTDLSADDRAKAEKHLDAHAKTEKVGDYAEDDKRDKAATQGRDPQALSDLFCKQLSEALEGAQWLRKSEP